MLVWLKAWYLFCQYIIKRQVVCFKPCVYIANFFIDLGSNISYIISSNKKKSLPSAKVLDIMAYRPLGAKHYLNHVDFISHGLSGRMGIVIACVRPSVCLSVNFTLSAR